MLQAHLLSRLGLIGIQITRMLVHIQYIIQYSLKVQVEKMTTLKITVDSKKKAQLLTRLLKSMDFVKKVEEETPLTPISDQYARLNELINAIRPKSLFSSIDDPIGWQKTLRDEWETR